MQSSRRSSHFKPERSSGAEGYGLTFGNQSITTPRTGTLIAGDLLYNGAFALPGEHRPAQHDAWLEIVPGGGEDDVCGIALTVLNWQRPRWPSVFMCPITGSIAERRRSSRSMAPQRSGSHRRPR